MTTAAARPARVDGRRLGRSFGAVAAGLLANIVLSLGTDIALHAGGVYPPWFHPMEDRLWVLALAYRAVFAVVGGYVTARLAPRSPGRHVAALVALGTLLGLVGVLVNWNKGPEFGPHWYGVTLILSAIAFTWLGGRLQARRRTTH